MDTGKGYEDKLREAACFGDEEAVKKLIDKGVNVNGQHEINGWTALHWAAKRGHASIVTYLLSRGANKSIPTKKGELAGLLTDNDDIARLLDVPSIGVSQLEEKLPIIPNYIAYPPVQYKVEIEGVSKSTGPLQNGSVLHSNSIPPKLENLRQPHTYGGISEELVLKVRVAQAQDQDFIEIELPFGDLTFSRLLKVCCEELQLETGQVAKIRKLPDTVLRKDKDVQRLNNFQELELVTCSSRFLDTQYSGPSYPLNTSTQSSRSGFANSKIFY